MNYVEELGLDLDISRFEYPELGDDYLDEDGVPVVATQDANQVHRYAWRILVGEIPACVQIKQMCLRHVKDIIRSETDITYPYKFNNNRAQHTIDFYGICKHTKGDLKGTPVQLMQWQQFIVGSLFGWITKNKHKRYGKRLRRFRIAEVFVARKNGKSTFACPIALDMMVMDNEGGAEIYSAATSRDQAKIVWDDSAKMVKNCELKDIIKTKNNHMGCSGNDSVYRPLSSDANGLDGLNVHCAIIDKFCPPL